MIKPRRILAVAYKEWLHVVRDPRSLTLAVLIPVFLMFLFGWALTLDVSNIPTMVWDQSGTPQSRELLSAVRGSRYFSVVADVDHYAEIEKGLISGRARVALVVPQDFAREIAAGRDVVVQVLADGSDANTAQLALGYVEAIARSLSTKLALTQIQRGQIQPVAVPVDYRPRAWYNTELRSQNFIIPGLVAFIMAVIAALLASLTVAREWERGTMEQLISTPLRGPELIIGKLIPYWAIGMLDVLLAVLLGRLVFGVPMRGDPLLLMVMAGVFLIGVLSQGVLLSVILRNQVLASQLAIMSTFVPTLILSGFIFSIGNMPRPLQVLSYIVPSRYFITALRGIFLKGVGLEVLAGPACLLLVYGTLFFILAVRRFRKKLV